MTQGNKETKLKQLDATLQSLQRIFGPHEINPSVRPIVQLVRQARALANDLGELMTNSDSSATERDLAATKNLLLKALTDAQGKEATIEEQQAEIERLKKLLEPPAS